MPVEEFWVAVMECSEIDIYKVGIASASIGIGLWDGSTSLSIQLSTSIYNQ